MRWKRDVFFFRLPTKEISRVREKPRGERYLDGMREQAELWRSRERGEKPLQNRFERG